MGAIALPVGEGRQHLWQKTKESFKYVYKHHFAEGDWFLKADDDSFVVLENLRYMLYQYSSDFPIYFGFKYRAIVHQGYMSGGAGYVLSKKAVHRLVKVPLPNSENAEDVVMGIYLVF